MTFVKVMIARFHSVRRPTQKNVIGLENLVDVNLINVLTNMLNKEL